MQPAAEELMLSLVFGALGGAIVTPILVRLVCGRGFGWLGNFLAGVIGGLIAGLIGFTAGIGTVIGPDGSIMGFLQNMVGGGIGGAVALIPALFAKKSQGRSDQLR